MFETVLDAAVAGELPSKGNYFLSALRSVSSWSCCFATKRPCPPCPRTLKKDVISHQVSKVSECFVSKKEQHSSRQAGPEQHVKDLTGKAVTSSTAQVLTLPALWIKSITLHLAQAEQHGETRLNARFKEAETRYDAYMKSLEDQEARLSKSTK